MNEVFAIESRSATAWPQRDEQSVTETDAAFLQADYCSLVKTKADLSQPNLLGASVRA
jgi:hypothetical protein